MTPEFWHARWQAGEIGFHKPEVHLFLAKYWPELGLHGDERVFVPLCGKSLDMLWLAAQGHRVVGVEVSPRAVADFFDENHLSPQRQSVGPFERWASGDLEILQGDFFQLTPELLGPVGAVYDRASLVALPPELRTGYAATFRQWLAPDLPTLLITLDYDQTQMDGPPFAVSADEVRALYGDHCEVTLLQDLDILAEEPRFRAKGLDRLHEMVWRLQGQNSS